MYSGSETKFSQLTPIYVPKNYGKCTCLGFDPVAPLEGKRNFE